MNQPFSGKDHMNAVFNNKNTDRIPVRAMQGFRPILDIAGLTSKEVLTQPDKYVAALQTVLELCPSDAATILVGDPALMAEFAGMSFEEAKSLPPGKSLRDDKSALKKFSALQADQYERLHYFTQICEQAVKALPNEVVDVFTISPWSTAMMLRGVETVIFDTMDDPEFAHALLRFTTDISKIVGDAILKTGVDMLTIGDPSAGCSVISPKMFKEWVNPYLKETVDHFKHQGNTPVFLHICGYTDPIMEDLVALGIDGLSIDAPSSLEKLVEISKKKIVIEGNFPMELFLEGSKEQIETKVKESVNIAAEPNGYRYILCSGCQVPDPAPLENVKTFLAAGKHYGHRKSHSSTPQS